MGKCIRGKWNSSSFSNWVQKALNLKKCVKIGTIGFKNSKFELTPPLRESLKKSSVARLDQRFSSKKKLANSSLDL
jgi:hypothetical protein